MNVTIDCFYENTSWTISPTSCILNRAVCNESLQHVENSCTFKANYEPELFQKIITYPEFNAIVKSETGEIVFTGMVTTDISWNDMGVPYPIENLSLTIRDYTSKLSITTTEELALRNVTLNKIIQTIADQCGLVIDFTNVPHIMVPIFVMPAGKQFNSVLDALCYQYGIAFYFDIFGRLSFFNFSSIPEAFTLFTDIMADVPVKKTKKKYDAVEIGYSTLTEKQNEQIFFESFGYDSDHSPTPIILQPEVYYPFESDPRIEETEGKVYQSFASGYAESRKKYNGEYEYRRSKNTTLLYSYNHKVVEDWAGSIVIDRTEFESQRAAVRFQNTGEEDASLRQFAIRADAIYRNATGYITVGSGAKEQTFKSELEYVYTADRAESIANTLFRYISKGNVSVGFSTDNIPIEPGTFLNIDTGASGFMVDLLLLSFTLDCSNDIYTFSSMSVTDPAVDITREKEYASDDRGDKTPLPDATPPTVPEISSLTCDSRGRVLIKYTVSLDTHSGVAAYTIYRKKGIDDVKKIIEIPAWMPRQYLDEDTEKGFTYTYFISATDRAGNESELSHGDEITVAVYNPPHPVLNLTAIADNKDFIRLSWDKPLVDDETSQISYYKLWISRDAGTSWDQIQLTNINSLWYYYDREKDGYPEKTDLEQFRIRIKSVSIYEVESNTYTMTTIDYTRYKTWLPSIPELISSSAGRTINIVASGQDWYGPGGNDYQISKDGITWYKPSLDTNDAYVYEDAWHLEVDAFVYARNGEITQELPLEGQTQNIPINTTYYYRSRAISLQDDKTILHRSEWSGKKTTMAKATGVKDVVENAIGTAQLQPGAVTMENLNVLAKNIINPCIDGTKDGWEADHGTVILDTDIGMYVLEISGGSYFKSNAFDVLPDSMYEVKFGLVAKSDNSGSGLYLGLGPAASYLVYRFDWQNNAWVPAGTLATPYFIENFTHSEKKYYKTYILGNRIDITSVPAPHAMDSSYDVFCIQVTDTTASIFIKGDFTSYDPDNRWYLITPQVYRIGDGKIIAENIQTRDLSAISANLGKVEGGPDYKLVLSDGFPGNENKKGTLLLGSENDKAYLRRWWDGSIWQMAIKLATLVIDAIASNIFGRLRVFRREQNSDTAKPTFDTDPGTNPGNEITTVRGLFQVKKDTTNTPEGELNTLEVLQNGDVSVGRQVITSVDNIEFSHIEDHMEWRDKTTKEIKFILDGKVSFQNYVERFEDTITMPNLMARYVSFEYEGKAYFPRYGGNLLEIFDLLSQTFQTITMPSSMHRLISFLHEGKAYFPGSGPGEERIEVLDIASMTFDIIDMPNSNWRATYFIYQGKVYLPGESGTKLEILDLSSMMIQTVTMPNSMYRKTCFEYKGKGYFPEAGGGTKLEILDLSSMTFQTITMPNSMNRSVCFVYEDKAYFPQSQGTKLEILNLSSMTFQTVTMPNHMERYSFFIYEGKAYFPSNSRTELEILNLSSMTFQTVTMPTKSERHTCFVHERKAYFPGTGVNLEIYTLDEVNQSPRFNIGAGFHGRGEDAKGTYYRLFDGAKLYVANGSITNIQGPPGQKGDKGDKGIQGLPGQNGKDGNAATIEIGTVIPGDSAEDAAITNTGSNTAAVLDFVLPKGDPGQIVPDITQLSPLNMLAETEDLFYIYDHSAQALKKADSSIFFNLIQGMVNEQVLKKSVPVGTVIYCMNKTNFDGYLYCNGSVFFTELYPEFYSMWLNSSLGDPLSPGYCGRDPLSGYPRLPDLRGVVLRAVDDGKGLEGASAVNEYQFDALQRHKHKQYPVNISGNPDGWGDYGRNYWNNNWGDSGLYTEETMTGRSANETRIKSKSVYPFIKII